MHNTLKTLFFLSCISLVASNRVYVHPFNLFAYGNSSCETVEGQDEKLPDKMTFVPTPIELQNGSEPGSPIQRGSSGTKQEVTQHTYVLAGLQNMLGLRMYSAMSKQKKTGNILFSPVNSFGTLVTLYLGASKHTATRLQHLIGIVKETDKENCTSPIDGHKVLHALQNINSLIDGSSDELTTVVWTFLNTGIKLSEEFVKGIQDFSDHSYLREVHFSNPQHAESLVNSFVEATSSRKVKSLFNAIDSSTDLLFASYVHFKGKWKKAFEPHLTEMQEFWTDDTTKVAVPLMSQSGVFQYFSDKNRNCFVIKLPFSKKAYMLLVLSIKGTDLNHIEALLTSDVISEWQHNLKKGFVHLSLPKFSMGTVSDLKEILTTIKLPDLLGKSSDFTKLSNKEHLTIDKVLNKVIFEVTEEGSENHADSRDSIPTPLELKINKPFFFAVVEGNSDALLLLGRITNPSSN